MLLSGVGVRVGIATSSSSNNYGALVKDSADNVTWGAATAQKGESTAHNNLPPAKAAYVWKRTA